MIVTDQLLIEKELVNVHLMLFLLVAAVQPQSEEGYTTIHSTVVANGLVEKDVVQRQSFPLTLSLVSVILVTAVASIVGGFLLVVILPGLREDLAPLITQE